MGPESRTAEKIIGRLASRSHGVVSRAELIEAGITPGEIKRRLKRGSLLAEFRGVYRVGHQAPNLEARYLAAVKGCGNGALLTGRAAGHLWRLLKGAPPPPEILALTERRLPGVVVHRARRGNLTDATTHPTPRQVEAVLARRPSSPGARKLRSILHGEVKVTLSKLEARFLTRLREAGLPLPETNRPAGGRRVDCRWPAHRLTVELDGYRYHSSRHAWERDRRREREARARGDEFRRYTYSDVFEDPAYMLRELRQLLPLPR